MKDENRKPYSHMEQEFIELERDALMYVCSCDDCMSDSCGENLDE